MSDPTPDTSGMATVSEEFFLRVNDFIQMANRIERRYDTQHAQTAMLHAFARYSSHHFRSTTKKDDLEERAAFANYIGNAVAQQVMSHIEQLAGPAAPGEGAGEPAAE